MRASVLLLATLGGVLAAPACGGDERPQATAREATRGEGDRPEAAEASAPPLFSRNRSLMGTVFVLQAEAPEPVAAPAIARAFDEIARLEGLLSEWQDTSEVSRINAAAGEAPVPVSEDAYRVVEAGVNVGRWSDGAFDLSWAALFGAYDFRPGRQRLPDPASLQPKLQLIDHRQIVLDPEARTVFLTRPGMAIGTGGIAKGYALDRAGAILREAGITNYMLFGGGQVQVHGRREGRPWRVGIQHPRRAQDYFAFFEADAGSISTSGDYEHFVVDGDGRRWHHILDTDTGLPARKSVSVTLLAPSGLYADALSTAAFVLGPEGALAMLARLAEEGPPGARGAEVVLLDAGCRLHATPDTERRLRYRIPLGSDGVLPGCADAP
ncbi:MAG: FAD:protein FMN transferase [Myxococcota bacterium]